VRIVVKRVMDVRVILIEDPLLVDFLLHGMNKIIGSARNVGVETIG
tara:strand:+ start:381 stop:518 length:138 start_codon:yes stop_codon:yes gene_type:complete